MTELFRRAYLNGGTLRTFRDGKVAWTVMRWNVAGNCQRPKFVEILGRVELKRARTIVSTEKSNATHRLELEVRCRKCDGCQRAHAAHWRMRALTEFRVAPRTWMVTLTFRPDVHHWSVLVARRHLGRNGVDFDALTDAEKFSIRHGILQKEVTKMLKRLRKEKARFRYMLVLEPHKSGLPHYHLLMHEIVGAPPLRHSRLKAQWPHGFVKPKLVKDGKGATYACKYVADSPAARVRASVGYGGAENGLWPEVT